MYHSLINFGVSILCYALNVLKSPDKIPQSTILKRWTFSFHIIMPQPIVGLLCI